MADDPKQQEDQEPTAEDEAKMQEVAMAGASAKAQGKDPAPAMKDARDEAGFVKLSDEDIDKLATRLNELNIDSFREAGAFDPPPEPVSPPAQPQVPPAPNEKPAEEAHKPPPPPRTFADRFLGIP